MIARKIQIAGTLICALLFLLGSVVEGVLPRFPAFEVMYFGLALTGIPMVVASTLWIARKAPVSLARWRTRLYVTGIVLLTVMYLSVPGVWALRIAYVLKQGRWVVFSGWAVFCIAFILAFFGKGWGRVASLVATCCCFFVWTFPFALD
jgi:hypothetical protein